MKAGAVPGFCVQDFEIAIRNLASQAGMGRFLHWFEKN
jgi:hypothetical protein